METKFYAKLFLPLLFLLLQMVEGFSQAPPKTKVGTATFSTDTWSVPITGEEYTNVGNISLKLNYDNTKLVYTGVTLNSGLVPANAVTTPVSDQSGHFSLSYTSAAAVVLAASSDDTLLILTFTVKPGVQGAHVDLIWSPFQGDCDITPPIPGAYVPVITAGNMATYFFNGFINVAPVPEISGPAAACTGTFGTYSTATGMNSYVWTVSAGDSIASVNGTNSIIVFWKTPGTRNVSVTYTDPLAGPALLPTSKEVVVTDSPVPVIDGPLILGLPAVLHSGVTADQVYTTDPGMTVYQWTVSSAGHIESGENSNSITVTWTNPTGQQLVTVTYIGTAGCPALKPTELIINYNPFLQAIDATTVPKFVDPLPHFAAGLRVDAKAGGHLVVKAQITQQVALSTGTVTTTGIIGNPLTPDAGKGNYAGYAISVGDDQHFGPVNWPAQTIEAKVGNELTVEYRNELVGVKYSDFNILADQTLMMNGYPKTGDVLTDPYTGPIPMVVHLHGGEMPSNSDGGPTAWFMPKYSDFGPGFLHHASSLSTYPNKQEATTLWYHPHDQGLTRINVYTGLAGYYFLRGPDEEAAKLPGWSGDGMVQEVAPVGKQPSALSAGPYLPEVEIAIQDRMFNVKGELFWPVEPTNPEIHPFWTPEFFGDIMTVNGKSWPYLSVAPRKYRFRMLGGCNARFVNVWLQNQATGTPGLPINVIGSDGGLLSSPAVLDPNQSQTLTIGPGERYDVVIDFTGVPEGTVFTLMNNAPTPWPDGDPVVEGLTDRIMQFVVNGTLVSPDNSQLPNNLRPLNPMVKLSDFAGGLSAGVVPDLKREIILNEVSGAGGPVQVLFNNSHFDDSGPIEGAPLEFGGPTELPVEGTTEQISVINTTIDGHPIHIHLLQWQLVSRQKFNTAGYLAAYSAAWGSAPEFPVGQGYPGGGGSPLPYNTPNDEGALGGNPAVKPFLTGPLILPDAQEMGWKDDIKSYPGQVATYIVRIAPTDKPIGAPPADLLFPFDPSIGPGYVWHCHIVDHEDMDMMRPLLIQPSPLRFPQITTQPAPALACIGDVVTYSVAATSATAITYKWQISTDSGTSWTDLTESVPYSGVTTSSLRIDHSAMALTTKQYRCLLTNIDGVTISNAALLTVTDCKISGTVKYNNTSYELLPGMIVTIDGKSATTDVSGGFSISGVKSGVYPVSVDANGKATGGINSTDAGWVNYWSANYASMPIEYVKYIAGDVNNDTEIQSADAQAIQRYFVLDQAFARAPWSFQKAHVTTTSNPPAFTIAVNGTDTNLDILAMGTGDFNGSFNANGPKGASQEIQLALGDTRKVTTDKEFELPLRSTSKMQVGAVSLILDIPSDLVDVTGVYLKGSKSPVTYNVKGNELRIGWNSMSSVDVQPDGELVVLKLKATPAFFEGLSFGLGINPNPLNEIADGSFKAISEVVLTADAIEAVAAKGESLGSGLLLSNYPNPVKEYTNLYYSIPTDGSVTLNLVNALGESVSTLVKEFKVAGRYTLYLDASSLPQGMYMVTLKLSSNNAEIRRTIKLIIHNN